ncbi:MAG: hypothetical protein LBC68_13315, partial [Prevotellaceae bacterium]|nr:hypothetical protein [Prevotellaceae bacterium]
MKNREHPKNREYPDNLNLTHFDCGSDYCPNDDTLFVAELNEEVYGYGKCADVGNGFYDEKYPLYLALDGHINGTTEPCRAMDI